MIGGLTVTTDPEQQALDLFGQPGHRFWIEVSDAQLDRMNARGGEWGPIDPGYGDIYTPDPTLSEVASYADHVLVQDVTSGSVADYGQMEVRLIGQSTYRPWTPATIPNVRIDTNEFQDDLRIGTFEHIRLNNSLVGTIFREHIALRVYRALGYPAVRSNYVFLGSNVWGEGTFIPMTLAEVYKRRFCEDHQDLLGGDCVNMWEYSGEFEVGGVPPEACQIDTCDNTRLDELYAAIQQAPWGAGFRDALAHLVDWPRFHQFQCLSWMLNTSDDALHASNNILLIERSDGKFVYAPYSIDISMGQEFSGSVSLLGMSPLAGGCQGDPACWADTVATCEMLIRNFDALNPELLVDETVATLTELDMMREGDDERASALRQWFVARQEGLAPELERYRYLPDAWGNCPNGLIMCTDGACGTPEDCQTRCMPDMQWCEPRQLCVWVGEPCVQCEGGTPYFCPPIGACVESYDACSEQCNWGPGMVYCEALGYCELPEWCPGFAGGGAMDGGVIP